MRHPSSILRSLALAGVLLAASASQAHAYANSATFRGQGLIADGFGSYDLQTELCGLANGADAEGPYLLFVLTATGAKFADITGPWGTAAMTKFGNGTFKYVSAWYDPDQLLSEGVTATYDGKAKNAQLVISHGCRPFTSGAWCSPGFWKNAKPAAWALVGHSPAELFNVTVYDFWFGATWAADPSLGAVLASPPTYSGAPNAGTSGYALNAFNATGAYLSNALPGYQFDWGVMTAGGDDACPIDHHGNWK